MADTGSADVIDPGDPSTCPFCVIVRGKDPAARVVDRTSSTVAFLPLNPATRGHTLVVPTRHVPTVWGLEAAEAEALARETTRIAEAVRGAVNPDGMNIIQSNGAAATQTVPHLHVHLVPRRHGDRMILDWPDGPAEDGDAQDRTLAEIRDSLPTVPENGDPPAPAGNPPAPADAPPGPAGAPPVSPEDRRQHLDFIQSTITRMSQASSSAKTWALPIVTATYGYAIVEDAWGVALLGILAVVIFAILDANYLKQERAFRHLYDQVARGGPIPTFSMNSTLAAPAGSTVNYWPDAADLRSWSIALVYGPLLAAGIVIAIWFAIVPV
ncbi:HIT family protein [Millisia brevis]|uniref:HIT family protein n=1 Tax=Millisia brevis TaxID=264148 RepID=UPI000AE6D61D|nr:HIT domain-containing protein [Millisia brevis]